MSPQRKPTTMLNRPNPFETLFQEITEIARAALRQSAYAELRELSCDFDGGILTLRGRVPTYYLKQLAQEAVADVPGVVEVENHVEVDVVGGYSGINWGRGLEAAAAAQGLSD
jgi:osmotically-inducible protein OsmY